MSSRGRNEAFKTLFVPSWYTDPRYPQSGVFFREQAAMLNRYCDVRVAVFSHFKFRQLAAYLRSRTVGETTGDGGVRHVHTAAWNPLPFGPGRFERTYRAAARRLGGRLATQGWRPDVIHAHSVFPGALYARYLGRAIGAPYVITEHRTSLPLLFDGGKLENVVRGLYRDAAALYCVSDGLRDECRRFGITRGIGIMPNFIDTDFFTCGSGGGSGGFRVLFVGSLMRKKGVDVLLEAFSSFLGTDPALGYELVLAGDGPERDALRAAAESLGITGRCRFLGNVGRRGVLDEMRACDVLVLPSRKETFGVVVLEAMACGKPVIVTASGGPEYFVTPACGIVVPAENATALSGALGDVRNGNGRYEPAAIRNYVVENFSAAAVCGRIMDGYAAVAA